MNDDVYTIEKIFQIISGVALLFWKYDPSALLFTQLKCVTIRKGYSQSLFLYILGCTYNIIIYSITPRL